MSKDSLSAHSGAEAFQRVCELIRHSAEEAGIEKLLTDPTFVPMTEPAIPEAATPDNSRKYELTLKKYEAQRKAISDLRKEAAEYLSQEVQKELAIRMGKSATAILSAEELYRGMLQHYCVLTEAKSNELAWAIQAKWVEGTRLSAHIMKHAEARAQQIAGGRKSTEESSKEMLWLSLEGLRRNALYGSLVDKWRLLIENDAVPMSQVVASFVSDLKDLRYQALDMEAASADETALSAKESPKSRESARDKALQKFKNRVKECKSKHKDVPLDSDCPEHPDARVPHTWGECSLHLGKRMQFGKEASK
jgi:hypothetical protein